MNPQPFRERGRHMEPNIKNHVHYVRRRWAVLGLVVGMATCFVYHIVTKWHGTEEM